MKETVNLRRFIEAFREVGRLDYIGGVEGATLLFEYLENLEEESGVELELDPIGITADFSCDTVEQIAEDFGITREEVIPTLEAEDRLIAVLADGRILYRYA